MLEREIAAAAPQLTILDDPRTTTVTRDLGALLDAAERELAAWRAAGIRLVTLFEEGYPANLRAVHDRPALLFVAGALTESDTRSLAVIGSRRASPAGLAAAGATARHLVASGFTVVSGLAQGIDTAAHAAALDAGGRTVAVIGTGLDHAYPPQNAALQEAIISRGAVVSQFWPETPASKHTFPLRNATMSGLALGSVIVEASVRSGARVQARRALAHGRPVFLFRRLLDQEWARQLAERPGTYVVETPEEITATIDRLTGAGALMG